MVACKFSHQPIHWWKCSNQHLPTTSSSGVQLRKASAPPTSSATAAAAAFTPAQTTAVVAVRQGSDGAAINRWGFHWDLMDILLKIPLKVLDSQWISMEIPNNREIHGDLIPCWFNRNSWGMQISPYESIWVCKTLSILIHINPTSHSPITMVISWRWNHTFGTIQMGVLNINRDGTNADYNS